LRVEVGELGVGVLGCFAAEGGGDVDGGKLYALADKLERLVRMGLVIGFGEGVEYSQA
jgi:hypothetical protein